jgi:hypothetical protein
LYKFVEENFENQPINDNRGNPLACFPVCRVKTIWREAFSLQIISLKIIKLFIQKTFFQLKNNQTWDNE